ncbi:MAG: WYL domain-containing protein [Oscillospiraceae bacterium]|nr:WYL domain-containing protein [Oscillospiraceae bacterium]
MIFNELYSAYYNSVAKIIAAVIDGKTDDETLSKIVSDNAFGESMLTVLPSIKSEKWQLIKSDMTTELKHIPSMPLTLIQKQWLKAVSLDPRIKLFNVQITGLEKVEPLFTPEDYFIYDKYGDGDPYDDENYGEHFRTVLYALKNGKNLKIEMLNRRGNTVFMKCVPERLEYSEKDDKFRLAVSGNRFIKTVNLARITKCRVFDDPVFHSSAPKEKLESLTLKVREERNTLERCMLHFAHFEKRAEKADGHYLLHIKFNSDDEPEMVIRVLSFGPTVEVMGPASFKNKIIDKLKSQKSCELN